MKTIFIGTLKFVVKMAGFELIDKIQIRHKASEKRV